MAIFSEDTYEQALIELFQQLEGNHYRYQYAPDIKRDYTNPILDDVLHKSLQRINPLLPESAIDDVARKLHQIEGSSLYECNFKFTQMMQYGVEVTFNEAEREARRETEGKVGRGTGRTHMLCFKASHLESVFPVIKDSSKVAFVKFVEGLSMLPGVKAYVEKYEKEQRKE